MGLTNPGSHATPRSTTPSFRPNPRFQPGNPARSLMGTDQTPLIEHEAEMNNSVPPPTSARMAAAAGRIHPRLQGMVTTWASSFFILIYVVMMVVSIWINGGFEELSVNPMIGPSVQTLNNLGANNAAEVKYKEELWRLITPIFLHAGIVHLGFNVYVQSAIGSELEAMWGSGTWLIVFLLGGIFGNLASCIFMPTSIGVGASGGIMAMLGGWFVELICHWSDDDPVHFLDPAEARLCRKQRIKQLCFLALNIAITFALSVVPLVDWAAHVGGCIGGMIVGAHLFSSDVIGTCSKTCTLWISTLALLVLSIGGLWYLFDEVDPCPDIGKDGFTDYLPPTC